MKILAVSDVQSQSLEDMIDRNPEKFGLADCVVSCGDLESDYLSNIVEKLKIKFIFVSGNHVFRDDACSEDEKNQLSNLPSDYWFKARLCIAGVQDLHGRIEVFKDYIFAGFGGSMLYNRRENQFMEPQMREIVNSVIRKIRWIRFKEKLFGRKPKEIIVLSHAPVAGTHDLPDIPHKGFECFKKFIKKVRPILWLHGHVDPTGSGKPQITVSGGTTVVNVFGCKIIDIENKKVSVKSHCAEI